MCGEGGVHILNHKFLSSKETPKLYTDSLSLLWPAVGVYCEGYSLMVVLHWHCMEMMGKHYSTKRILAG